MRDIRFRFWNGEQNRFFYADTLQSITYVSKLAGNIPLHWMVHQQYTGLKDKNGTEIYEGDIAKLLRKDNKIGMVFYYEYSFDVELEDGELVGGKFLYDCEIIRNIFENPDLIK